jgi:hypothetical protein
MVVSIVSRKNYSRACRFFPRLVDVRAAKLLECCLSRKSTQKGPFWILVLTKSKELLL